MMQVLINSFIMAGLIAIFAVGLTLIFGLEKFANAAHGSFIMLGAYLGYTFSVIFGLNFGISILLAVLSIGILAVLVNEIVYLKLKPYGGLTTMIASMALALMFDNLARIIWGPDPRAYKVRLGQIIQVLGAYITLRQIIILAISLLAMIGLHLLLVKTKIGKAWRAYSSNSDLASSCGIDAKKIVRWLWFMCGSYAAIGGILFAMDTTLEPLMGWNILLILFATCIVGGIGNPYGAMLGSLVIGFAMNFIPAVNWAKILGPGFSWYIPTLYKYAVGYFVMIVVLILRPTGILKR